QRRGAPRPRSGRSRSPRIDCSRTPRDPRTEPRKREGRALVSSAATRVTMLDRFERRTVLHLRLEATTAFRIGVGRSHDATTTDLPVLRDAAGVPVIPGSSLKGVVRSQIEALMRARNIEACDPFVAPC